MVRRKIIIDTDCGGDDAIAIMAALSAPDVEIAMISVVWGNVDVDQGMENIGKLLDLYNRDVPIFKGADQPLLGERETVQWGGFGEDGFGDAGFPKSMRPASSSKQHAALAIIDCINAIDPLEEDVVWQIISLGPLTNLALACRLCPTLFQNLGNKDIPGLTAMAGAMEAKGNSNLTAEFNVHCDPEAARIVFLHKSLTSPLYFISWELTVNCAITWEWYDKWINRKRHADGSTRAVDQTRIQIFIEKLFGRLEVFTRPADDGTKADTGDAESTQDVTCVIPDAVAMVAALFPNFIEDSFDTFVTVELQGKESRGMTCIDWYGTDQSMAKKGRWRNAKVVTKCKLESYLEAMQSIADFDIDAQQ
jgi:purine nucleosidase